MYLIIRRGNERDACQVTQYLSPGDVFRSDRQIKSHEYSAQVPKVMYDARREALHELAEGIIHGADHLETIFLDIPGSMTWNSHGRMINNGRLDDCGLLEGPAKGTPYYVPAMYSYEAAKIILMGDQVEGFLKLRDGVKRLSGALPKWLRFHIKTISTAFSTVGSAVSRILSQVGALPLKTLLTSALLTKVSALPTVEEQLIEIASISESAGNSGWPFGSSLPHFSGWPFILMGLLKIFAVFGLSKKFRRERAFGLAVLVSDLVWINIKEDASTTPYVLWMTFVECCTFTLAFAVVQFRTYKMSYFHAVAIVLSAAGLNFVATHSISSNRASPMPSSAQHLLPSLGISILYWSYHASLAPIASDSQPYILPL
jgi:hypothetical protein